MTAPFHRLVPPTTRRGRTWPNVLSAASSGGKFRPTCDSERGKFGCDARRTEVAESSMTENRTKDGSVGENRPVKFVIALLVFPTFVMVFHLFLIVPAFFVNFLLVHFGGNPKLWVTTLSMVAFLPATSGAVAVCEWIWPSSK